MRRSAELAKGGAVVLAFGLLAAPRAASALNDPAALRLVETTLDAMGFGRDPRAIRTVGAKVESLTFDHFQNDHLGPPFMVKGFSTAFVVDDYQARTQVATPDRAPGRTVLASQVQAWLAGAAGQTVVLALPPPPAWEIQDPLRALLLARAAADLKQEPDVMRHQARQHVVAFHHGRWPVRIYVDERLGLPTATEAMVSFDEGSTDVVALKSFGDIVERSEFMAYDLSAGLRAPLQTDVYRNDRPYRVVLRSSPRIDAPEDRVVMESLPKLEPAQKLDLDKLALTRPLPGGPDPKRSIEEIAPGVVQIPGAWYTTLVAQDDGVVILDAPISSGYSRQVLEEAARRFPGLPVKALITSTPFYWHVAGIREYAARGIPIYGQDRNLPVLRAVLTAPHALAPDHLSQHRAKAPLRSISGPMRLGSGRNGLLILPVRYGEQPMLMTYLAQARLLHTAEMVQPLGRDGALLYPEALLEIDRSIAEACLPTAGLRLIGMHMSPTPLTALAPVIAAAAANPAKAPISPPAPPACVQPQPRRFQKSAAWDQRPPDRSSAACRRCSWSSQTAGRRSGLGRRAARRTDPCDR